MLLCSLTKPLRSPEKLWGNSQNICVLWETLDLLKNFCVPPKKFAFACKTFQFSQETLCLLAKLLSPPKKLCIRSQNFSIFPRNYIVCKTLPFPRETLCSLTKLCSLPEERFICLQNFSIYQRNCAHSQNFCIPPRIVVFARKTLQLPRETVLTPKTFASSHETLCLLAKRLPSQKNFVLEMQYLRENAKPLWVSTNLLWRKQLLWKHKITET